MAIDHQHSSASDTGTPRRYFGLSPAERDECLLVWEVTRDKFGPHHPHTLVAASSLCVAFGFERQSHVSIDTLRRALGLFEYEERATGCDHANLHGGLNIAAQAVMRWHDGDFEAGAALANTSYIVLDDERSAHDADVIRVVHLGAMCWLERGGHRQAQTALACVEGRLGRVADKEKEVLQEHGDLAQKVRSAVTAAPRIRPAKKRRR